MKTLTLNKDILTEAGIPEQFWRYGADTFLGSAESLRVANLYVENSAEVLRDNIGLVFRGDTESGKTFLITYVLKCLAVKGYSVRYITLSHLTDLMLGANEERERSFRVTATDAQFLAIDSIEEKINKGSIDCLATLIRLRINRNMPLFLGMTFSAREFRNVYGKDSLRRVESHSTEVMCQQFSAKHFEAKRESNTFLKKLC